MEIQQRMGKVNETNSLGKQIGKGSREQTEGWLCLILSKRAGIWIYIDQLDGEYGVEFLPRKTWWKN